MYDLSTANPVNPQGTAGGGNVFNAGSIFGQALSLASGSSGDDGASTGSSDTAALGGPASNAGVNPAAAVSTLTSLLSSPTALLIAGAGAVLLVVFLIVHFFRK